MFERLTSGPVIGSVVVCVVVAGVIWHERSLGAGPPGNRPIVAPEGNYVTSNSCRACHPGNYAGWHTSFPRTMTTLARPAPLIPQARGGGGRCAGGA